MSTTTPSTGLAASNGAPPAAQRLALANGEVNGLKKKTVLDELDADGWSRWSGHLAERKRPKPITDAFARLRWAMPPRVAASDTPQLLRQLEKTLRKKSAARGTLAELAEPWLAEAPQRLADAALGLEATAWCYVLPRLAQQAPTALWCEMVACLLQLAEEAQAEEGQRNPLAHQILAGELPLTLCFMLPEVQASRRQFKPARGVLSEGVWELLDDEGLPHGKHLPIIGPLFACWTRAAMIGQNLKKSCFNRDSKEAYGQFVRQAIRLSRPDGRQLLARDARSDWSGPLRAALEVTGDGRAAATADVYLAATKPAKTNGQQRRLLKPSANSEWGEIAVLRSSWRKDARQILVNYSEGRMASELVSGQRVIWSGACQPRLAVGGRQHSLTVGWEEVCWFSDDDVDYLEMQAEFDGDWTIQRQFLLAREDGFLYVADAILGRREESLQYECDWPIDRSLQCRAAEETAEYTLLAGKPIANVMPLALPEWKCEGRRAGTLQAGEAGLSYQVHRTGPRLYVPLFIDLSPSRLKNQFTWRQLSVGQDLEAVRPDVAAGYRVQAGSQQWLFYRSLAELASRTVLGQNTFHEFVGGRFDRRGEVDPLIEIE